MESENSWTELVGLIGGSTKWKEEVKVVRPRWLRRCAECRRRFWCFSSGKIYCGDKKKRAGCIYQRYLARREKARIKQAENLGAEKKRFELLVKYTFTCQYCGRKA